MAKSNSIGAAGGTSFEKMGDSIVDQVIGDVGGRQSPNTISRPRSGGKSDKDPGAAGHRTGKLERQGASYAPTAKLYEQNAAAASQTQVNTRLVSSALGNRDFYAKRQYGQVTQ